MTEEQKNLLMRDLCARLLYKVCAQIPDEYGSYTSTIESIDIDGFVKDFEGKLIEIEYIKPYLFPLSSMTEEQKEDMIKSSCGIGSDKNVFDWFNKNHFDYRGLIPLGLAIDCTNLNIY